MSKKEQITILLSQMSENLAKMQPLDEAPETYAALIDEVVRLELKTELDFLQPFLAIPDEVFDEQFTEHFLNRCHARNQQNQGTWLHFFANPNGLCNNLYGMMAVMLKPEASEASRFRMLLPQVEQFWSLHITQQAQLSSTGRKKVLITGVELKVNPIALFELEVSEANVMANLLVIDNVVLDLKELSQLDFERHRKLHQWLTKHQLPLKKAIAAHNPMLSGLYSLLDRLQGEGASLQASIFEMVDEMGNSGNVAGYAELASASGMQAAARLLTYYTSLPAEIKRQLGACQIEPRWTFDDLINEIYKSDACIETISMGLKQILTSPVHQAFLATRPLLDDITYRELLTPYQSLPDGFYKEAGPMKKTLPAALSKKVYQQFVPRQCGALSMALLIFPKEDFIWFVVDAVSQISEAFPQGYRNMVVALRMVKESPDNRYEAFVEALLTTKTVFSNKGLNYLLHTFLLLGDLSSFMKVLNKLTSRERLDLIRGMVPLMLQHMTSDQYQTVLCLLSDKQQKQLVQKHLDLLFGKLPFLQVTLKQLSVEKRYALYQEEGVLHRLFYCGHEALALSLLSELSELQRDSVVSQIYGLHHRNLLHRVALKSPWFVVPILNLLSPFGRFFVVMANDDRQKNVLHVTINTDFFREIMGMLLEEQRFAALTQSEGASGTSFLQDCLNIMTCTPNDPLFSFRRALSFVPEARLFLSASVLFQCGKLGLIEFAMSDRVLISLIPSDLQKNFIQQLRLRKSALVTSKGFFRSPMNIDAQFAADALPMTPPPVMSALSTTSLPAERPLPMTPP